MSMSSRSDSGDSSNLDIQELLLIGERCRELRKEKDLLKQSQSQSYDLVKRIELHVKNLNEARFNDKKLIQNLERELKNCYDEIEYLQDQLNTRNAEVGHLGEYAHRLETKLSDWGRLQDEVVSLKDQLNRSNQEVLFLKEEVKSKEMELQKSMLEVDKLEESISFSALESQCEIESLRLELMSLQQNSAKINNNSEAESMDLIVELETQIWNAYETMKMLKVENKDLRSMLDASGVHVNNFVQRIEKHLKDLLDTKENLPKNSSYEFGLDDDETSTSEHVDMYGEVLAPLLLKLLSKRMLRANAVGGSEQMPCQIHEYETLVNKLREELKEEKFKAKEEAEELAQEMAELRYQLTQMLEEERKHRASIEQTSLHRISQLEAQLQNERSKSVEPLTKSRSTSFVNY